jgi:hypothetical protein
MAQLGVKVQKAIYQVLNLTGNYSAVVGRTRINADKTQMDAAFYLKIGENQRKSASSAF